MNLPWDYRSAIQEDFREQSLEQLKKLKPSDIVIFDHNPIPDNYTIVAHLDEKTRVVISSIQDKLRAIDPKQYYYPLQQLHLTLLGNIDIKSDANTIYGAISQTFNSPLTFVFYGLGSNKYCASMSAYPNNFSVVTFRKTLRDLIGDQGDDYSVHLSAYEKVGWINLMRYLQSPRVELIKELYDNKDSFFGVFTVKKISVYRNKSKVLAPNQSELLKEFTLP